MLYDWIGFDAPEGVELSQSALPSETRVEKTETPAVLVERGGKLWRPVRLTIRHAGPPVEAAFAIFGEAMVNATVSLKRGTQEIELTALAVEKEPQERGQKSGAGDACAPEDFAGSGVERPDLALPAGDHDIEPAIEVHVGAEGLVERTQTGGARP